MALGNLVLSRRDSLLLDVRSMVPVEEVARLRYADLPSSSGLFPSPLLDSALAKMRAASNVALVQQTLLPPKIPRKSSAGPVKAGSSSAFSADRGGTSPVVLRSQKQASTAPSSSTQQGRERRGLKGKAPFSSASGGSSRSGGKRGGPGRSPPDGVPPQLRVRGCLSVHWRHWQAVGAESMVLSVLRDGYRIPFRESSPPLARTPISFPTYWAGSPRSLALRQEVKKMLSKDALEIVLNPGPGFYSRLFLVEMVTAGWRPVIDLSHLNEFVLQTPFKMETVASVLLSVREGDFIASIDLKDAYFQIPVYQSSRKLLRFLSGGTVYQFKALCFGLSTAPQVDTRVFAHSHGIRLLRYLDDWLVLASLESEAKKNIQDLHSLCHSLGIVIYEEKSDLVPSQTANYLGVTINTGAARIFPSLAWVEKFLSVVETFCVLSVPPAQLWWVLLGHLASLERLVPHSRLRMCSLQWHLQTHWSLELDPPSLPVPLSREVSEELSWWMVSDYHLNGVQFGTPIPDLYLYSDASWSGWGAHLLDRYMSGVWSEEEKLLHINLLEMKAMFLALQSFREEVAGRRVTVMCDNSTVVTYVNIQGGTVSRSLCSLASRLLRWTESLDIHVSGRYQGSPMFWPISSAVRIRLEEPSGLSTRRWRELCFALGAPRHLICSQQVSMRSSPVLFPSPGSPGDLRGCVSPSLGQPGRLRVSTLSSSQKGGGSNPRDPQSLHDSGRPPLAGEGVVRRPSPSADPSTSRAALVGPAVAAAPLQPVPPRRPRAEPSRVATLQRILQNSGFSRGSAIEMSSCARTSTSRLWMLFCGWCRGRGVAPVNATIPLIMDFLAHLRRDKGLSISAVKCYQSALNSVFALKGMDLALSRPISMLIRSFSKSARPEQLRPPAWDVTLVLQSLTRVPYEPLQTSDERFLAQKTLFLLALTSAEQVGELHVLSYRVFHSRDLGEVSFSRTS